ncbi:MAG TPA: glycosyltransferase family 4 protein [Bradyrhizobium sp.]|nr:glycosyltransferase family 4 protein [Bradyrhizobium sp.]
MRVVTSCFGRFYIFDQAVQLQRHGMLHRLISAAPVFPRANWPIAPDKIDTLIGNFALGYAHHKLAAALSAKVNSRLREYTHNAFSARLAKRIPGGTDVFIGLSSYCYEAILEGKRRGIRTIVDHGSLHEAAERRILLNESEKFGFGLSGNSAQSWLIEKEDREFHAADHVFTISKVARRTMVENGVAPEKIFVNHGGVSLAHFYPCGKDDKVFRIIYCASLIPRKGLHYLLQAYRDLALPKAELWIVGPDLGLREDAKFGSLVRGLCTESVFFKGPAPWSNLKTVFSQGSVFVLPSLADAFGLVVPMAMACGIPVIVSDMTGAADLVSEGENGFVVPAADAEALKEKLQFLYDRQDLCVEMGRRAKEMTTSAGTWNEYGDRLAAFMNGLKPS